MKDAVQTVPFFVEHLMDSDSVFFKVDYKKEEA